jgi:hypothetical protein
MVFAKQFYFVRETKRKSATDLVVSKVQVHVAIRRAPPGGNRGLMIRVNTSVSFLNLNGLLLAVSEL